MNLSFNNGQLSNCDLQNINQQNFCDTIISKFCYKISDFSLSKRCAIYECCREAVKQAVGDSAPHIGMVGPPRPCGQTCLAYMGW